MEAEEKKSDVAVIKTSLQSLNWKTDHVQALRQLVGVTHNLTVHTYQLARWVFINKLQDDPSFDPATRFGTNFFASVFNALAKRQYQKSSENKLLTTKSNVALIDSYARSYMDAAGIEQADYGPMCQVAGHVNSMIEKDYLVNVNLRFGECLRRAINVLLGVKRQEAELKKSMKGASRADIRKACSQQIWMPARHIKESLRSRHPNREKLSPEAQQVFDKLAPIWATYTDASKDAASADAGKKVKAAKAKKDEFAKDDIYYDAKANPRRHLKAFYLICQLLEAYGTKSIQCFPLRTSWIYSHMHVDAMILRQQVIGKANAKGRGRKKKTSNGSGDSGLADAGGSGDGSAADAGGSGDGGAAGSGDGGSTAMSDSKSKARKAKKPTSCTDPLKECPRIDDVPHKELLATDGNCVVTDPGCKDLQTLLHESSTPENPRWYRYTRNQRNKETRMKRFANIREKAKGAVEDNRVREAEMMLQGVCRSTLDPAKFEEYIRVRAEVWPVLEHFYNETMTTYAKSTHQVHKKYVPANPSWSKRKARAMKPYADKTPQSHPLHRKLRLSAYWNQ
ncbi:hypothetical protein EV183_001679 [Coemansia sp. RSA 2336]|nr:hypothetical protein EV183_001679 [Coemansia sp. RSA 2336]